jgi:hypothetical protein
VHENLPSFDVAEVAQQLAELYLVLDDCAADLDDEKTLSLPLLERDPLPAPLVREGSR